MAIRHVAESPHVDSVACALGEALCRAALWSAAHRRSEATRCSGVAGRTRCAEVEITGQSAVRSGRSADEVGTYAACRAPCSATRVSRSPRFPTSRSVNRIMCRGHREWTARARTARGNSSGEALTVGCSRELRLSVRPLLDAGLETYSLPAGSRARSRVQTLFPLSVCGWAGGGGKCTPYA